MWNYERDLCAEVQENVKGAVLPSTRVQSSVRGAVTLKCTLKGRISSNVGDVPSDFDWSIEFGLHWVTAE